MSLLFNFLTLRAIAAVVGVWLLLREAEKRGLDSARCFRIALAALAGVFLGARLYVVLFDDRAGAFFDFAQGGIASYGALAGGLAAALLACAIERVPAPAFLDSGAPSVALAVVLGRIGCFVNGCCYGSTSSLPWAVNPSPDTDAYAAQVSGGLISAGQAALPVHPVQLYEAGFAALVFVYLLRTRRRPAPDGIQFATLAAFYGFGRFVIEFARADTRGTVSLLSLPQAWSLAAILLAGGFCVVAWRRALHPRTS
jgi:phosphatidylglycerol:prolipoprotein diacylglycerol transferase